MKANQKFAALFILLGLTITATACSSFGQSRWSDEELSTLRTLWIESLPPLSADPSNKYADNPEAAAFGQKLFFDTRFSSNGEVACSTCHLPDKLFQDGIP